MIGRRRGASDRPPVAKAERCAWHRVRFGTNYATALLDSLSSPGDVDRALQELDLFAALLDKLPALGRVLDYPGMAIERRESALDGALEKMNAHPTVRRFLHIVVEKGRVPEIPSIVAAFRRLRDARRNVTTAEVVTAVPIDAAARSRWEQTLGRVTGKQVSVTYRTDDALLGGALARVGSVVYDGSVRKQLARIRGILLGEQVERRS